MKSKKIIIYQSFSYSADISEVEIPKFQIIAVSKIGNPLTLTGLGLVSLYPVQPVSQSYIITGPSDGHWLFEHHFGCQLCSK